MSHPVNDNHKEILGAFISEIIAMRNRFANYMAKWELWDFLTPEEQEFMNQLSIICTKLTDQEEINRNGNMGQQQSTRKPPTT